VLDIDGPEDHRNRQSEAQPELVAKHCDGVSRVTIVTPMSFGHFVRGMRIDRLPVIMMRHIVHVT
jgi:hypothetical protein